MKKIYTTILFALMAMASFAQETNDTVYVMMDFNQNPWNYPIREITSGWTPNYKDWDAPGAILKATDFSWPVSTGSTENIKVTLNAVDLDEYEKVSVYANYELNDAEASQLGINPGKTNMLYTQPGSTMRFEAPAGYKFGKLLFYNYRNANFLVGDEYEEEYSYVYNETTFTQKLKVWTPASPKVKEYPEQDLKYSMWEGDEKNILFNYPYFSAIFVKIDIRLVKDGSSGISVQTADKTNNNKVISLDGRAINGANRLNKGVYIVNGKKYVVK